MFYKGDVVECIDDNWRNYETSKMNGVGPKKGEKFTVSCVCHNPLVGCAITLVEQRWPHPFGGEIMFKGDNFRLLYRKSTEEGMAILRGILDGQPIKETIDA